jgi:hypothetical protein
MSISPISSDPQSTHQIAQVAPVNNQASETAKTDSHKPKTDSVTISKQAILMRSRDYSPSEEASESAADKAFEKMQGQK